MNNINVNTNSKWQRVVLFLLIPISLIGIGFFLRGPISKLFNKDPYPTVQVFVSSDIHETAGKYTSDIYQEYASLQMVVAKLRQKPQYDGLQVKTSTVPFQELLNSASQAKITKNTKGIVALGGLSQREALPKNVVFIAPHWKEVNSVFLKKSGPVSNSSALGVQKGTVQEEEVNQDKVRFPNVFVYDDLTALVNALTNGKVSAILVDDIVAQTLQTRLKEEVGHYEMLGFYFNLSDNAEDPKIFPTATPAGSTVGYYGHTKFPEFNQEFKDLLFETIVTESISEA